MFLYQELYRFPYRPLKKVHSAPLREIHEQIFLTKIEYAVNIIGSEVSI